jgi:hypothetical protein
VPLRALALLALVALAGSGPGCAEIAPPPQPLDLAVLGNGAYDPWIANHADPEQVWQMFVDSGAGWLVPVHRDTFRLGEGPLGDAMRRLTAAAGAQLERSVLREIGGEWREQDGGRSS